MSDNQPAKNWDALAELLGAEIKPAVPPPQPAAAVKPAPRKDKPVAKPASTPGWNDLASELGIEVPATPPPLPAASIPPPLPASAASPPAASAPPADPVSAPSDVPPRERPPRRDRDEPRGGSRPPAHGRSGSGRSGSGDGGRGRGEGGRGRGDGGRGRQPPPQRQDRRDDRPVAAEPIGDGFDFEDDLEIAPAGLDRNYDLLPEDEAAEGSEGTLSARETDGERDSGTAEGGKEGGERRGRRRRRRRGRRTREESKTDLASESVAASTAGAQIAEDDEGVEFDSDRAAAGVDVEGAERTSTDGPDSGEARKPRRRRRRRRGGRKEGTESSTGGRTASDGTRHDLSADNAERARPTSSDDDDDSDEEGLAADSRVQDDEQDHDDKSLHKSITTWQEAVGMIVAANMESRARNPNSGDRRPRGGRGRGRGR